MSFQNIPAELRALRQWVVAGANKHPLDPRTYAAASVTNPETWGSFEEALAAGAPHLGFVLTAQDPFCIVDLDDPATFKKDGVTYQETDAEKVATITARHAQIFAAFETYAELSQSGAGVHIVCKGAIPRGVRRYKVEMYSSERYMIFTGNVLKPLPVTDQQPLLSAMFADMEAGALATTELDEETRSHLTDDELYTMASTAANAEKFCRLWRGEWQGVPEWPSQSEADFALLAMLGFYSQDNEQVRRVFRFSALGKREKATKNNKYLNYALSKIRAKLPPPIDFAQLVARGSALVPSENYESSLEVGHSPSREPTEIPNHSPDSLPRVHTKPPLQPIRAGESETTFEPAHDAEGTENDLAGRKASRNGPALPPGFVGELAEYMFQSAIRPVREIALCAAIGLTAGVVGRSFNVSGTGLNQYLILLAKTGTGKEGLNAGIDRMVTAVRPTVPTIDEFIGPGAFASGQALVRVLDRNPCFVSVLGEFGLTLQQLCSPNANAAQVMLKKVLLDIYAKSGGNAVLRSSVYSDSDKNTKAIQAPNVTLIGESTPETFYSGLDAASIAEGLLPRFSVFEYTGPRPAQNENAFFAPAENLVRAFGSLAAVAMSSQQSRATTPVIQDADALRLAREFNRHADKQINGGGSEVSRQLWNRAHLKSLKMAGLIAVGVNPHAPTITKEIAEWAIALVVRDIETLLTKFESGEVGTGDVRLEAHLRRMVLDYLQMTPEHRHAYKTPDKMATMALVPFQYLRRRAQRLSDFRNDRRGINAALKAILSAMVEGEVLSLLSPMQSREQCGTNSPVYAIGPAW